MASRTGQGPNRRADLLPHPVASGQRASVLLCARASDFPVCPVQDLFPDVAPSLPSPSDPPPPIPARHPQKAVNDIGSLVPSPGLRGAVCSYILLFP